VQFPHAECDFNNTQKRDLYMNQYEVDMKEWYYNTHEFDFYTHEYDFDTYECDDSTLTSMILTHMCVI
jgi:hypothetical protein